jgi:transposase
MTKARQSSRRKREMSPVHAHAAAIDIGATLHVAAVNPECDPEPVRSFGTFTGDLHRLADWFERCGVRTVAMESTGVYWIPIFEVLEQRGFAVVVVNARDAKHVPGRKTDVSDAGWLQRLHEYGLLRASFRPEARIAALRDYLRQRERLLDYAASHIQHMQKALMQMNLQLHHVVSDITGATGMRIIRAFVAGEREPAALASLRDRHCKASDETIRKALTGNDREEHVFALTQALELYDAYQTKVIECDKRIEAVLERLQADCPAPAAPLPAPRHRTQQPNALAFPAREALHRIIGVDLTQIHGFGPYLALKLVGECGTDLSPWPSVKHFTSWLCLAPSNKISGGKVLSARTRRSSNRAAALLRLAAITVGRTETALGAFYRRLSGRVGKAKAVTATARKIAVLFYNTLRHGLAYADPGASYYEERYRRRVLSNLQRRAKSLGFVLQAANPIPTPLEVS